MSSVKYALPWIEKYRPKSLDEIVDHTEKVETLKSLIHKNEMTHLLFHGLPGSAKCLGKGTLIRLYNGSLKKVEEIVAGDLLMGDRSDPRKVLSICNGTDQLFKIKQDRGIEYIVNAPHILSLMKMRSSRLKWDSRQYAYRVEWSEDHHPKSQKFYVQKANSTASDNPPDGVIMYHSKDLALTSATQFLHEIQKKPNVTEHGSVIDIPLKDYLRKSDTWKEDYRGYKVMVDFPHQDVALDPYILGLWQSSMIPDHVSNLQLVRDHPKIVSYISNFAREHHLSILNKESTPLAFEIKVHSSHLNLFAEMMKTDQFIKHENNYEPQIPSVYLYNSRNIRLKVLAGILDQIGSLHGHTYKVVHKSGFWIDQIMTLAQSLGYYVHKNVDLTSCKYQVEISGNDFSDLPTLTTHHNRPSSSDFLLSRITVEKLDRGAYYGFELDGNGRFLLEDYTVTHNTSMIMAMAQEMYGDQYKKYILELNASDDRGIETVRKKIPDFVKTASNKIRLVILDEADAMTHDAQSALRRVIEKYSKNSRFCLIGNNINKIIPGLQSRCTKMRFGYLNPDKIKVKIKSIVEAENVCIEDEALDRLVSLNRDFRQILNTLQCLHAIRSSDTQQYKPITADEINEYLGIPTQSHITTLIDILFNHDFVDACREVLETFKNNQWNLPDLVRRLADHIVNESELEQSRKFYLLDRLSDIEIKLSHSNDAEVQLYALVSAFQQSLSY